MLRLALVAVWCDGLLYRMKMDNELQPMGSSPLFGNVLLRYVEEDYLGFRLLFAFVLALHGAQKAFLLWNFPADHPLGWKVDVAGWVEFVAAILIASGVFTRLGAGALAVQMVVAYFDVRYGNDLWPHIYPATGGFGATGGEVAILYFGIAGIIGVLGSRKYGLEQLLFKRGLL